MRECQGLFRHRGSWRACGLTSAACRGFPYGSRGGYAEGDLIGGNLSLVAASLGTRYEVNTAGRILFLEDVGEAPYRLDRMLCQLESSGKLDEAAGFLLGDFTDCASAEGASSLECQEVLRQYLAGKGKPCISGIPAGHARFNTTLPLGTRVAVNAGEPAGAADGEAAGTATVTFLERPTLA